MIARLRCFRGIDTLSAAGLCAEVGSCERFAKQLIGVPRDRADRVHLRQQTRAGPDHQGRAAARAPTARRGRAPLPPSARDRRSPRGPPAGQDPRVDPDRLARAATPARTLAAARPPAASPPASSRSLSRASSPHSAGRPQPSTDPPTNIPARPGLPGRARDHRATARRHATVRETAMGSHRHRRGGARS